MSENIIELWIWISTQIVIVFLAIALWYYHLNERDIFKKQLISEIFEKYQRIYRCQFKLDLTTSQTFKRRHKQ